MGLQHLANKRTGRPRGSKTAPAWVRALRWAERNLGNPDAEPPSDLARLLLTLGREYPDRFMACLALQAPIQGVVPGNRLPFKLTLSVVAHMDFVRQLWAHKASLPWVCKVQDFAVNYDRAEITFTLVPLGDEG
jgi:hypothetical protein